MQELIEANKGIFQLSEKGISFLKKAMDYCSLEYSDTDLPDYIYDMGKEAGLSEKQTLFVA